MAEVHDPIAAESGSRRAWRRYASTSARALLALLRPSTTAWNGPELEPNAASRAPARIRLALNLAIVAMVAINLFVAAVGIDFDIEGLRVRATTLQKPFLILFALVGLRWTLVDSASGRWLLPRVLREAARARLPARAGILLSMIVVANSWSAVPRLGQFMRKLGRSALADDELIRSDTHHAHLVPLVTWVAQHADTQPLVVVIDDVNPRGHLASFYCYPRVLWMTPAQQRWSGDLRKGMDRRSDPGFEPMSVRPSIDESLRWAVQRGASMIVARSDRVAELAANGASPADTERER